MIESSCQDTETERVLERPRITILVPTFNRVEILKTTLDAFSRLNIDGICLNVVVIANNCTDSTMQVAKEFETVLPLIALTEARPGKNAALNLALREVPLDDVVVFTDDDVTPDHNWLQEIVISLNKWPEVEVFGGKIDLLWPGGAQPTWAVADWTRAFGYSEHRYSEEPAFYEGTACPFGGNFWVRRSVFHKVPFFDETIGPRPKDRIMGSETSFLLALKEKGVIMLHYPAARVEHRIHEKECRIDALRRRGYTFGRGQVRLHGWRRHRLCARNRLFWMMAMIADTVNAALRYALGYIQGNSKRGCEMTVDAMIRFGNLRETYDAWRSVNKG